MTISPTRQMELQAIVRNSKPGGKISVKNAEEFEFVCKLLDDKVAKENREKVSDGSSADYYKLPKNAKQLQDLIAFRDMNAQVGEIFRATFRYGQCPHSSKERELNKIIFYARAEIARLKKYESVEILNLNVEDL